MTDYSRLKVLGRGPIPPPDPKEDYPELETVRVRGRVTTRLDVPNLVTVCPVTGQPDYGHLIIEYVPKEHVIETKSLKVYLMTFAHEEWAMFGEEVTFQIARDIWVAAAPLSTFVAITWAPRGGIGMTTSVTLDGFGEEVLDDGMEVGLKI